MAPSTATSTRKQHRLLPSQARGCRVSSCRRAMPCPEHGVVGGAVAVTMATLASELEQPDKTEPTAAIPQSGTDRFLLYPFHLYFHFISAQPKEGALASIHAKAAGGTNQYESSPSTSCEYRVGFRGFLNQASQRDRKREQQQTFLQVQSPYLLVITGNENQVHDNKETDMGRKDKTSSCGLRSPPLNFELQLGSHFSHSLVWTEIHHPPQGPSQWLKLNPQT